MSRPFARGRPPHVKLTRKQRAALERALLSLAPSLPDRRRLVLGVVVDHVDGAGYAYLLVETVAKKAGVSRSTAKRDNVFALNTVGGKSMWLEAESQQNMVDWIRAIQRSLGIV